MRTLHIPLHATMKLCKDCAHFESSDKAESFGDICTISVDPVHGTPVDAVSARTGQFCGLSGALYLKRVKS